MHLCQRGAFEECKKLLSLGVVDINCRDRNGSTALFHCCHPQQLKLVRLLLSMGLNPNLTNIRGNSVLHLAAERGFTEVILILMLYEADPYAYNLNGQRCEDLNPAVRPLIAGIYKDRSAYGLLLEAHKRKLIQIFEEMDADDSGFVDLAKCTKFNRFIEETSTEDNARRDSLEFLKEVSICREGKVNIEEWLFAFGKLVRDNGNESALEEFIGDYDRSIKERGKYAEFKARD